MPVELPYTYIPHIILTQKDSEKEKEESEKSSAMIQIRLWLKLLNKSVFL